MSSKLVVFLCALFIFVLFTEAYQDPDVKSLGLSAKIISDPELPQGKDIMVTIYCAFRFLATLFLICPVATAGRRRRGRDIIRVVLMRVHLNPLIPAQNLKPVSARKKKRKKEKISLGIGK
ncbi:hypothetical protein Glove_595g17 [Diversispora epigaea]|uniref:Uncharacterized protein n=1 Tax=Diversispora epigaea TaxID=1348612 RepID=A0A397GAX0_9GLOM|nr:hypothetical protein Glove_595g17 [Diversispora epigaea]